MNTFACTEAVPGTTTTGGYLTLSSPDLFHLSGNAIDKLGDVGGPGATIFASVLMDGSENLRSAINSRVA